MQNGYGKRYKAYTLKENGVKVLSAMENIPDTPEGIITEQTKMRLKELEAQISQYDFDIEQAKQRNYSYLTPEKIKDYFRKVICGDITADSTREHIIKYFIREIILYDDCLVITYNFTDKNIMKKTTPDDIDEVEKELKRAKSTHNNANLCLYKRPNSPTGAAARTKTAQKKKKPKIRFLNLGVRIPLLWCTITDRD